MAGQIEKFQTLLATLQRSVDEVLAKVDTVENRLTALETKQTEMQAKMMKGFRATSNCFEQCKAVIQACTNEIKVVREELSEHAGAISDPFG